MTDTMEVKGVVYGAPIDGVFDGDVFPEGLKKGDKVLVRWSHQDSGYFDGPYDVGSVWATLSGAQFRAPINHPIYGDGYGPEIKVEHQPAWLGDDELIHVQWEYGNWYPNGPVEVHCTTHTLWKAIRLPADHWAYPVIAKGFEPWAGGDDAPVDWDRGETMVRNGNIAIHSSWKHPWGGENGTGQNDYDIVGYRRRVEPVSELVDTEFDWAKGDYIVSVNDEVDGITNGRVYVLTEDADAFVEFNDDDGDDRVREKKNYRPATPEEIAAYKQANSGIPVDFDTVTIPKMTEDEALKLWHSYHSRDDTFTDEDAIDMLRSLGIVATPSLLSEFEAHHGGLDDNQRAILEIYQEWIAAQ